MGRLVHRTLPLVLLTACGSAQTTNLAECTARTDCASDEICRSGLCVPAPDRKVEDTARDAGVSYPDAAATPEPLADAGPSSSPDADVTQPELPDPGCPNAVRIVGGPAFCTIQAAIDAAANGDVIDVPAATYREQIVIRKPITINGAGASATTILGTTFGGAVVDIDARDVFLRNFAVDGDQRLIGIAMRGGIEVEAVEIRNTKMMGVAVTGIESDPTTAKLTGVRISRVAIDQNDMGVGVFTTMFAKTWIYDSQIENTQGDGVFAFQSGWVTINNTVILNASKDDCAAGRYCASGVWGKESSTVIIENNTRIAYSGHAGVFINGSTLRMSDSSSMHNGMAWNVGDGVLLTLSSNATIERSTLSENNWFGLSCYAGSTSVCTSNAITDNQAGNSICDGC